MIAENDRDLIDDHLKINDRERNRDLFSRSTNALGTPRTLCVLRTQSVLSCAALVYC